MLTIPLLFPRGGMADDALSHIPAAAADDPPTLCARLDQSRAVAPLLGRRGDGWPNRLEGRGIVTAMEPSSCSGTACDHGHLLIRVRSTTPDYGSDMLFAFKSCVPFTDLATYCNRPVRFTARKVLPSTKLCDPLPNSFDSGPVPHYMVDELEALDDK